MFVSSEDDLVIIVTSFCFSCWWSLADCMLSFDDYLPQTFSLWLSSQDEESLDGRFLLLELPCGAVYFLTSNKRPVIAYPRGLLAIDITPPLERVYVWVAVYEFYSSSFPFGFLFFALTILKKKRSSSFIFLNFSYASSYISLSLYFWAWERIYAAVLVFTTSYTFCQLFPYLSKAI